MRRCIALLALFVCSTASSETAWPLKTPTELKALHGIGFTGFQLLTYRLSELPNQTDQPSDIVIGVGRDIIFRDDGRRRRVVDFRLARIYDVDESGRYLNSPIAAEIVFRDTELANRLVLSKAISGAGISDKTAGFADPFWRGTELKVVAPNEGLPAVEWRMEGGVTTAFYKGEEVIRWEPTEAVLPAPVVANLGRVLLWFFNIHPALNARLAADGRAPQHFNVHWMSAGQTHADDYQLIESRWCEACEALSENMKPGFTGGAFERDLAPLMIAASEGQYKSVSSDEYLSRIETALDHKEFFRAWLWYLERALQDGVQRCQPTDIDNYCRVQLRLFAEGRNDDDVQTYAHCIAAPSVEHANTIVALRNRAGPNAYYIDLSSVNATPPSAFAWKTDLQEPLKSAEQRMASALHAMPMVPAVYRDIGNMYFASVLNARSAWIAWETGKAIEGRSGEAALWRPVDGIVMQTRQRHPEFY